MARILGLKLVKSATGKVTHVTLSRKHFADIVEDLLDGAEMDKHRSEKSIPWTDAKQKLNRIIKRKKSNA
jgi:signal transduction histidine kinase